MDSILLEEQLVIDELVGFWQTRNEPRDLTAHIRGTLKTGGPSVTSFFAKVRDDLRTDTHSMYAASSTFEFRQFLEAEYRRVAKPYLERLAGAKAFDEAQAKAEAERQAKIKAEAERQAQEREERVRKARADFDALGEEMAKTTIRAELVVLGRKREDLAPYTGIRHPYENICWKCHSRISSTIHARCSVCRWYICSCNACGCGYYEFYGYHDEAASPFLPDYPDDLS